MRRSISAYLTAVLLAFAALGPAPAAADPAPALVTVTGAVDAPNRPPFEPFDDALFKVLDVTFERAHALSFDALRSLPQQEMTLKHTPWPRAVTVSGPRLVDVLDAAGARGDTVLVRGVDGYAPEFKMTDIRAAADKFILAIAADGKPLSIGGRGPAWLALPSGTYPDQTDDDAALVWAVFNIEVR